MNTTRFLHKYIVVAIITVSGLCCPQISNAALPDVNVIKVYYNQELGQINKLVSGNNFIGYGTRVNIMNNGAGIWDPNRKESVTEVIDLAIATGTSIVRFPGGCGTHLYNWKNAIGPGRTEYQYGIDEFMTTANEIGAEVVMTVSYYTGNENDAADLVEYLNTPNDGSNPNGGTDWAATRASNGHPAPYNVKYFEVGNETWGSHADYIPPITNPTPGQYATRYLLYYDAMKAVDANSNIGVVSYAPGWKGWRETVATTAGNKVDFGIYHTYPSPKVSEAELLAMDPNEIYRITLGSPVLKDEAYIQELLRLSRVNAGRDVPLAVTEYNGGFARPKDPAYRHCLGTALLNAEMLRIFMKPKHQILMGNYWQFSNSYWGMVRTTEDLFAYVDHNYPDPIEYTNRPNYYPYEMYNDHFGDVLIDVEVDTSFYEIKDLNLIEYSGGVADLEGLIANYIEDTNIYYLTVNASKSQDGSKVYLMVINKNMYDNITATIALRDFVPAEQAEAWVLNGPSVDATNEDDPNNVKVVYKSFKINGNSFEFTFEPHSLTAMEITYNGPVDLGRAWAPSPDDGATDVDRDVGLSWEPGDWAASHDVYFGTNPDVTNNPNEVTVEPNYPVGTLDLGQSYYWQVDEVNDSDTNSPWPGYPWNFTTIDYLVVDDFEAYANSADLRNTWTNQGGATLYLETGAVDPNKVHSDSQSMNMDYGNTSNPYRSAAWRAPNDPNWTRDGVKALYLWFVGNATNDSTQMYVELEDANANTAEIVYTDTNGIPDANAIQLEDWTVWRIELQDFVDANNVDLANVAKLTISLGDGVTPGGSGDVWFDDIRLYVPRCLVALDTDFNGDCLIDLKDFAGLAQSWRQPLNWAELAVLAEYWLVPQLWP